MVKYNDESVATNSSLFVDRCREQPQYQGVVASLDLLSLLLGQPTSARLLWITLTSKQPDILNCNLALFYNLLYCLIIVHLFVIFLSPLSPGKLHNFIFVYVQVGGPMQLCFICLERFIAVIHPTHFLLLKKYKCREVCAASVWIISLPLAVMYILTYKELESVQDIIQHVPAFLMVTLSLIVLYTSFKVAKALRRSPVGKDSLHPTKRRAFITICVTSATALSCYVPVVAMGKLKDVDEMHYTCRLIPLCIFFLSVASLVHPMFYLYTKGEFNCQRCSKKPS